MSEALERGRHDFMDGLKLTQNPFRRGSKEYRAWNVGWHKQRLGTDDAN